MTDCDTPDAFSNSFFEIHYEPELQAVVAEWKGFAQGEARKQVLLRTLQMVKDQRARYVLVDIRNMYALTAADEAWSKTVFQPQMWEAGIRADAVVAGNQFLAKQLMTATTDTAPKHGVQVRFFSDATAARQWLKTRP